MSDCHSGTLHWCKGSQPLLLQQAALIITLRSEIIMCILTNTVIPHLSEQLSLFLSRGVLVWPIPTLTLTIYWDSQGSVWLLKVYFGLDFLTLYPKHTLFLSLFSPFSPPEDTAVSGLQPGCGGFTKAMSRVGLFFPRVGFWVEYLPLRVFCWACFAHTIDCRCCSGLSPADLEGD